MMRVGRECRVQHGAAAELLECWGLDLELLVGEARWREVGVEEEDTETVAFVVVAFVLGSDLG
jgi:hypothetical protein